jgi:hypothetical protein
MPIGPNTRGSGGSLTNDVAGLTADTVVKATGTTLADSRITDSGSGAVVVAAELKANSLQINDAGADNIITLDTASDEGGDRTLTIPALGENVTAMVTGDALTENVLPKSEATSGKLADSAFKDVAGVATVNTAKSTVDVDIDFLAAVAVLSA